MGQALEHDRAAREAEASDPSEQNRSRLLTAGGAFGALIVSSCCIAPLVLVTLGISGAWIGNLTALEPYRLYFLTGTALLLAAGFWHVYFKPKKACADGSYCARPASGRITKSVLWIATVLALLSATVNLWASLFY
ncbi:MAG: mercuric transporter MerT family protein [Woeseia sp.]